ncbi:MAG: glycosyltransferase family 1 protein [Gemmatimonadetes bacterium]|nr:MAG: glycosyltransferase family 1 protein [Gemmatimonadota bacterium]
MSQPRIALDVSFAKLVGIGVGVYASNIWAALTPLLGDRLVPVCSKFARPPRGARRTFRERLDTLMRDLWWHQAGVTVAARRCGAQLLHLPAGVGPVAGRFPAVTTIHDVMPIRFAPMFRPWYRRYAGFVMPRLARRARAVITVSQTAKQEIAEEFGLAPERISVIPHGVDPAFRPLLPGDPRVPDVRRRYELPEAFVLAVGSIEPRKNLERLLQAISLLRTRPGTRDVTLVHSGPEGWHVDHVAERVRQLGLSGAARFLGYTPAADLQVLYGLARAFVYPSLWEAFGLPVIEAMACGCPVVTSGLSSLPEIAGDAALFVDPHSADDIARGVAAVWEDGARRAVLVQKGLARVRDFTWARAARATIAVYEAALA